MTERTLQHQNAIRQDPDIRRLLSRLPESMENQLTDEHLCYLKVAIGSGNWRKHPVDLRGSFPLPFIRSKIYFVLLMGKNRRKLSRKEVNLGFISVVLLILIFFIISTGMGLLLLYLLKSALGINLFETFSIGIWEWFNALSL